MAGIIEHPRLERERQTIEIMIRLYCKDHHRVASPDTPERANICESCQQLELYAFSRLWHCPFGEGKPTCARCVVHCYNAGMRQKIKTVMKYGGPRMLLQHPVLAIRHLLDDRYHVPKPIGRKAE
jgi:hypothetical protein